MKKIYIIVLLIILVFLYYLNIIPHKKYTNEHFKIDTYISNIDKDSDLIDDQTDILNNALKYVKNKPRYKSKYYDTGYPNDNYGVCTDVIAFALLNSGYDLKKLVNDDILLHKEQYNIDNIDINIDFRRVANLKIYFDNNAIKLSTSLNDICEWQGGDIVVFENHIGIVSDKRNSKGMPFVIHHANIFQLNYEEDVINHYKIIGHYRIS